MTKSILITGGAGFIGSNFINYFIEKYNDYNIINLDALTPAANLNNIEIDEAHKSRYKFVEGDICDVELVNSIFDKHSIKGVIHFAAESHVDNSIKDPEKFIRTNVHGTFVLLNAAKQKWMDSPFTYKDGYSDSRFHHISTDEVFGTLGDSGHFTESSSYSPNSPYSASKASSDMIVRSYFHTYGLNTTISNCSNNYGIYQHDEKLIPTIIRHAIAGKPIPIYGNGKNIRDWLYVDDHCRAVDKIFHEGKSGDLYVVGGNSEKTNLELAGKICSILDIQKPKTKGSYANQISFVTDRAGHDYRYAIDFAKIRNTLAWKPLVTLEDGLAKTVSWYVGKYAK